MWGFTDGKNITQQKNMVATRGCAIYTVYNNTVIVVLTMCKPCDRYMTTKKKTLENMH